MKKLKLSMILTCILFLLSMDFYFAESPSSEHFIMQQWGITSGNDTCTGNQPQSTNYIITGSAIGIISDEDVTSENYINKPGYYLGSISFGILPPENVTISVVSGTVYLNWDPVNGADSYSVYSSSDPYLSYESWTLEESGITVTNWSEDIQQNIKKFYFVIALKN